jgi:hypothetical protein
MPEALGEASLHRGERIRLIGERTANPSRGHPVLFKGRYHEFPVTNVPHSALVYRVDNGRLAAELEEFAASKGTSLAALRSAAETGEVQSFLHRLLLAKAQSAEGPIFAELERLGQQTEPLLVMFDGLVINGNRRLAAMRELLGRDTARYRFGEPTVAVLPESTNARDIEYIEAALQMAPETKLRYGWLDRRLTLRKQRDALHLPLDEILAAYRIETAAEIERELAQLFLAEDYLRTYRGEPARYSVLADAEELFVGLQEQLSRLGQAQAAFWKIAGFAMIDGRSGQPSRSNAGGSKGHGEIAANSLSRLFPFAPAVPPELPVSAQRRLALRFGVVGDGSASAADPSGTDKLLTIFRNRSISRNTAKLIADVLDEMRLEHNERSAPQRMLQKLREAGQLIARLEPERLSRDQRSQLRGDLAALQSHAAYLMGRIEEKPNVPGRWRYTKPIFRPPFSKIPLRMLRRLGWNAPNRGR